MPRLKRVLFLLLLSSTAIVRAQKAGLNYEIARWQGNKQAAVSITLDDCIPSQFENAIPVLNDPFRKISVTFFLTGKSVSKNVSAVKQAYLAGHELANHSFTHPAKLADLPAVKIESELKECQDAIFKLFNKRLAYTMAYPNGSGQGNEAKDLNLRAILKRYAIGARATQINPSRINEYFWEAPFTDDSYYKVNSAMIGEGFTVEDFAGDLNKVITKGGWYCATYHGIGSGWIVTSTALFTSHMDEVVKRKDQLWIATFRDVIAYHKERNSAKLTALKESKHKWKLSLIDTLSDDNAFNVPLTIRMHTVGSNIKSVTQNGMRLSYKVHLDTLQFDAAPNKGNVVIRKSLKR